MTTARRTGRLFAALAALAAGCGGSLGTPRCQDGSCGTQVTTKKTFQANIDIRLDLLFVVDDTPAIAPYGATLPAGLADIASALSGTTAPDSLHVGFIRAGSCDASTRGGACGVTATEQFLRAEWCRTLTNTARGFVDTFSCLGDFGATDCGPSQPLAAALQLLASPPRAGWEGFLRPDAYLMIVVVAAEDDASGTPGSPTAVRDIAAAFKALKADPSQVLVSTIRPDPCPGGVPTPRLEQFANEFGANGLSISLCDVTLANAVQRVTERIAIDLAPPCLASVRDTDPQTPGLQAECSVTNVSRHPDGSMTKSSLPSCDAGAPPCWRMVPSGCPTGDGAHPGTVFSIYEAADWCEEAGLNVTIGCLSCADPNDPACAPQTQ